MVKKDISTGTGTTTDFAMRRAAKVAAARGAEEARERVNRNRCLVNILALLTTTVTATATATATTAPSLTYPSSATVKTKKTTGRKI